MHKIKNRVPSVGTKVDSSTNVGQHPSSHTIGNTMLPAVVSSKLRPILFSTEMVKAILEGRKTQTRRIAKIDGISKDGRCYKFKDVTVIDENEKVVTYSNKYVDEVLPKYKIGDILWVRETWQKSLNPNEFVYKADTDNPIYLDSNWKWKPSLFMPFDACRLFLKVTNIRVEKLQDISESDAQKEGAKYAPIEHLGNTWKSYKQGFEYLWQNINGKENWDLNPYVWVIEFERCSKTKKYWRWWGNIVPSDQITTKN